MNRFYSLAFVSSVLFAGAAQAQVTTTTEDKKGGGYGYEFKDDPLSAVGGGPSDDTIKVRVKGIRATLIRPRTSFVPEMLKSVENL